MGKEPSSWELDAFNAGVLEIAPDDADDALNVALTRQEFGMILWSIQLLSRVFPETSLVGLAFYQKLTELAHAQEWLDLPDESVEKLKDIFNTDYMDGLS